MRKARSLSVTASLFLLVAACKHEGGTTASSERLSDPEVVAALVAVHQGEIDAARIVVQKSTDAEIQGFATRMQTEHGAAIDRLQTISANNGFAPAGSDLSMMVTEESRELGQRLEAANGEDLDRLYAESQLEGHRKVLRMLDEVILPSVDSRELRTEVESQRAAVLSHIEHAERLHEGQQNPGSDAPSESHGDHAGSPNP